MEQNTVTQVFESRMDRLGVKEYNYDHYTRQDALMDARGTLSGKGIGPGCIAPDFELQDTDGNTIRLGDLKGRPVLLRFGNIS